MATFTQLYDTPLTTDVALASWCPTMDLCAVVTTDGQLQIHRLNWQVLWVTSPDQLITSICWRPDGKVLAAGHTNGSMTLFNIEAGQVLLKTQLSSKPWECLAWAEQAAPPSSSTKTSTSSSATGTDSDQHSYQQRFQRLFEPPPDPMPSTTTPASSTTPAPDAAGGSKQASSGSTSASWPPVAPTLNILAGISSDGKMVMSAFGEAHLAEVPRAAAAAAAGAAGGSETIQAQQLALTPDLRHALVLEKCNTGSAGALQLCLYDTSILSRHSGELHQLALLSSRTSQLLKGAQKSLKAARSEWKQAQADLAKRIAQLRDSLADHGRADVDLREELLALLATGHMHPGLNSWLCSVLGDSGLRRLARAVDHSVQACHTLVLEHLLPVAQLAGFLLGELAGLARACHRLPHLGLQVPLLQQAEAEAMKLVLRAELLRQGLSHVGSLYRCTFGWLLRSLKLAEGPQQDASDPEAPKPSVLKHPPAIDEVVEMLEGQLLLDGVAPEWEETAGMVSEEQVAAGTALLYREGSVEQCQQLVGLMYGQADKGPWPPRPLGQQLRHLQALCDSAFAHVKTAISPHIRLVQQVQLAPVPVQDLIYMDDLHLRMSLPSMAAQGQSKAGCQVHVCYGLSDSVALGDGPALGLLQLQLSQEDQRAGASQGETVALVSGSSGSSSSRGRCGISSAQGVVLELPEGVELVDLGFYKAGRVALLLQGADGSGTGTQRGPSLSLIDFDEADLAEVDVGDEAGAGGSTVLQCLAARCPVDDLPSRQRALGYEQVQPPLGVSGTRGVACVFGGLQRAAAFDLEEDEEGDEEEEEEGDDDDDDDDESMGQ